MNRKTLQVLAVIAALTCAGSASACMIGHKTELKVQQSSIAQIVLPVRLFVAVSQGPVRLVGKSLTTILRQLLIGHRKSHAMPIVGPMLFLK